MGGNANARKDILMIKDTFIYFTLAVRSGGLFAHRITSRI